MFEKWLKWKINNTIRVGNIKESDDLLYTEELSLFYSFIIFFCTLTAMKPCRTVEDSGEVDVD